MKKPLPLKSNRRAGFAARLARSVALLALVAAIGHLAGGGMEAHAAQPSHGDILNRVDAVQTTVDSIETKTTPSNRSSTSFRPPGARSCPSPSDLSS